MRGAPSAACGAASTLAGGASASVRGRFLERNGRRLGGFTGWCGRLLHANTGRLDPEPGRPLDPQPRRRGERPRWGRGRGQGRFRRGRGCCRHAGAGRTGAFDRRRRRRAVPAGKFSGPAASGSAVPAAVASAAALAALADFTSRGGPSLGAVGAAASGAAPPRPPRFEAVRCEKSEPAGRVTLRLRAIRSANCRATISSTVLDALLASIPCCVRSNWTTS